jgi:hypothetical protein
MSLQQRESRGPEIRQVLFVGNSQQFTTSLDFGALRDEKRLAVPAADLFGDALEVRAPGRFAVYTEAAPSQNFVEALWQGLWWFRVAPVSPGVLVLESSFDSYRAHGVRPGFQTLLEDPAYSVAITDFLRAHSSATWKPLMDVAIRDWTARTTATSHAETTSTRFETGLRRALDAVPLHRNSDGLRTAFLETLYYARVRTLHVNPTTRRHIAGAPLVSNFDALDTLVSLATESGATVLIYNAPQNPRVSLYYDDEYKAYLARLEALASAHHALYLDLATAVPASEWGRWLDLPDPMHVDERGHQTIARALDAAWGPLLTSATH